MDRHDVPGATAEDVANAHVSDLAAAPEHGVKFLSYWFDEEAGGVFCFADAPSRAALMDVHSASHGLVPNEIIPVSRDDVFRFLGRIHDPVTVAEQSSPVRTIMFTDLVDSTSILSRVGEGRFVELLALHDGIVREALYRHGGHEVKHTGDGIMASFPQALEAARAALAVIGGFEHLELPEAFSLSVRVGLAAGRPVDRNEDIFGEAVVLASRLCDVAEPGRILAAESARAEEVPDVRYLGPVDRLLKGFPAPTSVFEVIRP